MQLVVLIAVRKAVSAATTTFTAISITLFFITPNFYSTTNYANFTNFFSAHK